jgi:hypothetical protein
MPHSEYNVLNSYDLAREEQRKSIVNCF